jgi:hypothetical protein
LETRIEQWEGNYDGNGLEVIFTSTTNDEQRMNIYADASRPNVSKNAKDLDREKLMNRPDSDNVKRGGWMAHPKKLSIRETQPGVKF